MSELCDADELRTLFLFEQLSDEQLGILCTDGRIETFPEGVLFTQGEAARCFYVLIDGELVMSGRTAGIDVQTHRTSQRGAYCGAWSAYVPAAEQVYEVSVRLVRPSRFFVLDADSFARFMRTQFPMAVHLLSGHTLGTLRQQQVLGQRARLLGLGTITAGLTHQLNNPAAAISRAVASLRQSMRSLFTDVSVRAAQMSPLEAADREEQLGDWLDARGIPDGWDYAPTFAEAGLDIAWLEDVAATADDLPAVLHRLKHGIDAELSTREIAEASTRISALLAGAKQYSQMDRGDYQYADVHDLLRSTLLMFETADITVVTEWDQNLPEILCYPGDLNQVWTNLIENAVEAMGGGGTLTISTARDCETMIRVEIRDNGPGIPEDIIDRVFTPFFSTKPVGDGTGLGLDLAWRIVEKHRGTVSVQSAPADTRFIVCLPLQAPTPENAAAEVPVVRP